MTETTTQANEANPSATPEQPTREPASVEITYPPTTPDSPAPADNTAPPRRRSIWLKIELAVAAVVVLGLTGAGSYWLGYRDGRATSTARPMAVAANAPLQVPQGATIISQCSVGRGTQYVLPSDIPHGPVFNVYKGKVIGLEYMIGINDIQDGKSYINLPLYGRSYDHIDVGLLSQGHAGYPAPHYHVDIYNITHAQSAAITCK